MLAKKEAKKGADKKEAKKGADKKEAKKGADKKELLLFHISLLLLLLSVSLLTPEEGNFCRKCLCTIVSLFFVALVGTFP